MPWRTTQVIFIQFDIILLPLTHCFLIFEIPLKPPHRHYYHFFSSLHKIRMLQSRPYRTLSETSRLVTQRYTTVSIQLIFFKHVMDFLKYSYMGILGTPGLLETFFSEKCCSTLFLLFIVKCFGKISILPIIAML